MTALELLYRQHAPDVYRYAYGLLRNRADAEDAVQTTFLNAHRAFEKGVQPEDARPWLIRIAQNVCREGFRRASRRPAQVALFEDGIPSGEPDGPRAEEIRLALSQLSLNQRAVLVLRELEGRKYSEIASLLGLSVSAVETLLFRARRALREQLEDELGCEEAQRALDGPADGAMRAHLRACAECSRAARRQRALRGAAKTILGFPLPGWLASFFGGGAAVGAGIATKAVAFSAVGLLIAGGTYEAQRTGRQVVAKPAHGSAPAAAYRPAPHDVARSAPVAIASPRGKERDYGNRQQAKRGAGLAHLERGQARGKEEGQGRSAERKQAEAQDPGQRGRSAGSNRGRAAVLEKATALGRGRGLGRGHSARP